MASRRQSDPVITALSALAPDAQLSWGELVRDDGRHLRWIETNSTGPTILLVGGAGDTVLDWGPILPALATDFRVIAYDRAGLGASDPVRGRLTIESQVDDMVALLDAHGPTLLVGHSWGGLLAQFAAAARPAQVTGLVLIDPTHEGVMAVVPTRLRITSDLSLAWMVLLKYAGLFDKQLDRFAEGLMKVCSDDPATQQLVLAAYRAEYAERYQVASVRTENRLAGGVEAARRARAANPPADVPMTVLTATRGKLPVLQVRAAELAEETAAAYPQGQHIVVDDAGHYIHHDQPAAAAAAIKAAAG
ncbi:hydrolase or acyltransferase of alpha/beta superfamily protein [Asanoa ishikariensis]|uniref:Pimeloyl-ACP methyl ester carboxylesterase n=1 Tax=Asanoa ishikariensis TaxID=137265 RepID=A0A1H3MPL0_9ACTN|nr:alpha/beta hydrolase [Asanoa ishikariensis]GIF66259.1 hydrolase or acyltransferase of alpha/beta superfamily protein [Asanoa ishikariensis]SDY78424.1 Pimeloyl-ACP methyl ester carboxylesterase [Asanoa ishikariensis]